MYRSSSVPPNHGSQTHTDYNAGNDRARSGSAAENNSSHNVARQYACIFKDNESENVLNAYSNYMSVKQQDLKRIEKRTHLLKKIEVSLKENVLSMQHLQDDKVNLTFNRQSTIGSVKRNEDKFHTVEGIRKNNTLEIKFLQEKIAESKREISQLIDRINKYDSHSTRNMGKVREIEILLNENNRMKVDYERRERLLTSQAIRLIPRLAAEYSRVKNILRQLDDESQELHQKRADATINARVSMELANRFRQTVLVLQTEQHHTVGSIEELSGKIHILNELEERYSHEIEKGVRSIANYEEILDDIRNEMSKLISNNTKLSEVKIINENQIKQLSDYISDTQVKLNDLVNVMHSRLTKFYETRHRSAGSSQQEVPEASSSKSKNKDSSGFENQEKRRGTPAQGPSNIHKTEKDKSRSKALPYNGVKVNLSSENKISNEKIDAMIKQFISGGLTKTVLNDMREDIRHYLDHGNGEDALNFSDKYQNIFSSGIDETGVTRLNFAKLSTRINMVENK